MQGKVSSIGIYVIYVEPLQLENELHIFKIETIFDLILYTYFKVHGYFGGCINFRNMFVPGIAVFNITSFLFDERYAVHIVDACGAAQSTGNPYR